MTQNLKFFLEIHTDTLTKLDQYLLSDLSDCISANFNRDNFEVYFPELQKVLYGNFQNVNLLKLHSEITSLNVEWENGNIVAKRNLSTVFSKTNLIAETLTLQNELAKNIFQLIKQFSKVTF